jgi:hypothetical protein
MRCMSATSGQTNRGNVMRRAGRWRGDLRYPSETGDWQLGNLDLGEYLDRYRDQRLVLIIAPVGEAEPETYTCGICGFVMSDVRPAHGDANGAEVVTPACPPLCHPRRLTAPGRPSRSQRPACT